MTNFERLKANIAKLNEQEFIDLFGIEAICAFVSECRREEREQPTNCNDCLLDWLKSEAKEDDVDSESEEAAP